MNLTRSRILNIFIISAILFLVPLCAGAVQTYAAEAVPAANQADEAVPETDPAESSAYDVSDRELTDSETADPETSDAEISDFQTPVFETPDSGTSDSEISDSETSGREAFSDEASGYAAEEEGVTEQSILPEQEDISPTEPSDDPKTEYLLTRVEISDEVLTYTGKALKKQSVTVYGTITAEGKTTELKLEKNQDYTVEYSNNINAGTATVVINGLGNYEGGVLTETFEIFPAGITSVKIQYKSMSYTGKKRTQSGTTVVKSGKKILTKNADYKIRYENNIDPGMATMTITGKGNYTGTVTKTFSIKAKLDSARIEHESMKYTGKARTQSNSTVVTAKIDGRSVILSRGTDYKISYKNNINAGTATMIITGKGYYKGTITKKFKITKAQIKSASISSKERLYTGKAITTKTTVKAKVAGETVTLKKNRDYTVSYKNNIQVGTATVIIKGKGNFTGTFMKTFTITQIKLSGSGTGRIIKVGSISLSGNMRVAVWTSANGQDDLKWYKMNQLASGNWKVTVPLADFKDYGEAVAHVYDGEDFVCGIAFDVSNSDWLTAKADEFKSKFLYYSGGYENIDYVQCAINIANNNYYGYGHSWRTNGHTISCAGLVGLTLTYCGYGDFIKDDPVEPLDGGRWGYLDLGTYSGKYSWTEIMINEVGAEWHDGYDGIQPGDILYYDYGMDSNHTGIYLGNGITVESRGPYLFTDYDDTGSEIAIYTGSLDSLSWQGYFRIPNKHYF